jgi:hypothetical protein
MLAADADVGAANSEYIYPPFYSPNTIVRINGDGIALPTLRFRVPSPHATTCRIPRAAFHVVQPTGHASQHAAFHARTPLTPNPKHSPLVRLSAPGAQQKLVVQTGHS